MFREVGLPSPTLPPLMDNCFYSCWFILQILPFLNKRRPINRTVLLLAVELTLLHREGWTVGLFRPSSLQVSGDRSPITWMWWCVFAAIRTPVTGHTRLFQSCTCCYEGSHTFCHPSVSLRQVPQQSDRICAWSDLVSVPGWAGPCRFLPASSEPFPSALPLEYAVQP